MTDPMLRRNDQVRHDGWRAIIAETTRSTTSALRRQRGDVLKQRGLADRG